jgi:hypothetical protein
VEAIVKAYLIRLTIITLYLCRIVHLLLDDLAILKPIIEVNRSAKGNSNNLFFWASRNTVDTFLERNIVRGVANKMRRDLESNAKHRTIARYSRLTYLPGIPVTEVNQLNVLFKHVDHLRVFLEVVIGKAF